MNTPPLILVAGSANLDLVARAPRLPQPGETLQGRSFDRFPGGKGANQAVAAARLGGRTFFAGRIGDDSAGAALRGSLEGAGVDTLLLETVAEAHTGVALIVVDDAGESTIVVCAGANDGLDRAALEGLEKVLPSADALLLQLETPLDGVVAALEQARAVQVPAFLDCGPARALPDGVLELATVVSPNETEAEALTGIPIRSLDDARKAARALHDRGAPLTVIKLGAQGCFAYDGREERHVPAFPVEAVDSTAAGDAFMAGLAVAWREASLDGALRFANAAGALAATRHGAQASLPSRAEVDALLKEQAGPSARAGEAE